MSATGVGVSSVVGASMTCSRLGRPIYELRVYVAAEVDSARDWEAVRIEDGCGMDGGIKDLKRDFFGGVWGPQDDESEECKLHESEAESGSSSESATRLSARSSRIPCGPPYGVGGEICPSSPRGDGTRATGAGVVVAWEKTASLNIPSAMTANSSIRPCRWSQIRASSSRPQISATSRFHRHRFVGVSPSRR